MCIENRVASRLRLEKLQLQRYRDVLDEKFQQEKKQLIEAAAGVRSGKVGRDLREIRVQQCRSFIQETVRLREDTIQQIREVAVGAHFRVLTDLLTASIRGMMQILANRDHDLGSCLELTLSRRATADAMRLTGEAQREVQILEERYRLSEEIPVAVDPRTVVVVHGRNEMARKAMFQFLSSLQLSPVEWEEGVSWTGIASPSIPQILDAIFARAQAVVVLFTGDDVARLGTTFLRESDDSEERELTPQARQNVVFEAGLAFGLHPKRTLLVGLGKCRKFSDIAGLHVVQLSNDAKARHAIAQRLRNAECAVNTLGQNWLEFGDFDSARMEPDISECKNSGK